MAIPKSKVGLRLGTTDMFLQSGTGAVARLTNAKLRDPISVSDFGAVGNGVADDTAAIQAAITACPEGGVVLFPVGRFRTTSAFDSITKALTFRGCGGGSYNADVFGAAGWAAVLETGSIIETTITSGAVFTFAPASTKPFNITDLCIKGLGDDTRTTIGVRFKMNRALWSNVTFINLETGFTNATSESDDNVFNQIVVNGCKFGADLGYTVFNQNVFVQFNAMKCGTAMRLDGCAVNCVYGGAIQNCTAYGIDGVNVEESTFHGIYFENSAITSGAIHIKAGDSNVIRGCHISAATDDITIDSNNNTVETMKYGSGTVTFSAGSSGNRLLGPWPGTFTDSGDGNWREQYAAAIGPQLTFNAAGGGQSFIGPRVAQLFTTTAGTPIAVSVEARDDIARFRIHDTTNNFAFMNCVPVAGGGLGKIGFYNTTAVARQLLATGAGATVDQVITALQTLGLLKQS